MSWLEVKEIYPSIQGESSLAGYPCTFVRLAGCNLRCTYCDTKYAWEGGERMAPEEIIERVEEAGLSMVEITGGEPLLQDGAIPLMAALLERGRTVLLETNGSIPLEAIPEGVKKIMDVKCPGSGMEGSNIYENLSFLRSSDDVKFVLTGREDYDYALSVIERYGLPKRCTVLLSPAKGFIEPSLLAEWMVRDRMNARLQIPLHRVIWRGGRRV